MFWRSPSPELFHLLLCQCRASSATPEVRSQATVCALPRLCSPVGSFRPPIVCHSSWSQWDVWVSFWARQHPEPGSWEVLESWQIYIFSTYIFLYSVGVLPTEKWTKCIHWPSIYTYIIYIYIHKAHWLKNPRIIVAKCSTHIYIYTHTLNIGKSL